MHCCICTNACLVSTRKEKEISLKLLLLIIFVWKTNETINKKLHVLTRINSKPDQSINHITLSIQLSRSASLRSGGGLVTPESRVSVVGMNCNISRQFGIIYHSSPTIYLTKRRQMINLNVQNIRLHLKWYLTPIKW